MTPIPWFKHEPERTATGYRWLDLIVDPWIRVTAYLASRRLWRLMRIGDESWRQARTRTQRFFSEHPEFLDEEARRERG